MKKYQKIFQAIKRNHFVYYESDYLNTLFAKDGEIYDFNDKKILVIGVAYSVDKYYRLTREYNWYKSEQPNDEIKLRVTTNLMVSNNKVNIVLSHTCPYKYLPYQAFLDFIN